MTPNAETAHEHWPGQTRCEWCDLGKAAPADSVTRWSCGCEYDVKAGTWRVRCVLHQLRQDLWPWR